jgi:outer membrane protein assembly factor BamD
MHDLKLRRALLVAFVVALGACGQAFELKNFPTSETLYQAGLREFQRGRWDYAIQAFEKLTLDLPARDTLLPRAYWYLGKSHTHKKQYILAAQSFSRLTESFPDDSLADDALLEAGGAYAKMWRKPALDAQYGLSAISTYRTLLAIYPNSPLREPAERRASKLEQWFATKDYDTGMYYLRRKAYDPAILYFRDVIRLYPNTPKTREAYLRLVQSYRAIRYRDDARETCMAVRQLFPSDREVGTACAVYADSTALPSS